MGKKKVNDKTKNNNVCKYNVTDYNIDSCFFFDVTKIYPCINNLNDYSKLNLTEDEIISINEKIKVMRSSVKIKNTNNTIIEIIPEYKNYINNMELVDRSKTTYAKKINFIIQEERKKSSKAITLKPIK